MEAFDCALQANINKISFYKKTIAYLKWKKDNCLFVENHSNSKEHLELFSDTTDKKNKNGQDT